MAGANPNSPTDVPDPPALIHEPVALTDWVGRALWLWPVAGIAVVAGVGSRWGWQPAAAATVGIVAIAGSAIAAAARSRATALLAFLLSVLALCALVVRGETVQLDNAGEPTHTKTQPDRPHVLSRVEIARKHDLRG